ncbi:MAG TPA: copper resistance protein B, partial [Woeseiaceae bacterium]|nr:copper resistance protein B [Woeseiaceae bacterium]
GIAPYAFDVESALFVSEKGDVSARFEAEYDLHVTQRLILQPRFEIDAAFSDDREIGVGSGINETGLGVRLRYEIRREFAPYVGISWQRLYGKTADRARVEGEDGSVATLVAGVRTWF